jgi:hypothetical protein
LKKRGLFNKGQQQQNKAKRKQREREFGLVARENTYREILPPPCSQQRTQHAAKSENRFSHAGFIAIF